VGDPDMWVLSEVLREVSSLSCSVQQLQASNLGGFSAPQEPFFRHSQPSPQDAVPGETALLGSQAWIFATLLSIAQENRTCGPREPWPQGLEQVLSGSALTPAPVPGAHHLRLLRAAAEPPQAPRNRSSSKTLRPPRCCGRSRTSLSPRLRQRRKWRWRPSLPPRLSPAARGRYYPSVPQPLPPAHPRWAAEPRAVIPEESWSGPRRSVSSGDDQW
jgi:hypothetical protein